METDGALVLDTQRIQGVDGQEKEPAKNLVKAGDYIVGMNGDPIFDKKDLTEILNGLEGNEVVLKLRRSGEFLEVKTEAGRVSRMNISLGYGFE